MASPVGDIMRKRITSFSKPISIFIFIFYIYFYKIKEWQNKKGTNNVKFNDQSLAIRDWL